MSSGSRLVLSAALNGKVRCGRAPITVSEERQAETEKSYLELVLAIAARVRPVCQRMPEAEFRALVEQMARIEQKYIHYPNPVPTELRHEGPLWPDNA